MAISSALGGTIGAVPAGSVIPFAGTTSPSGWLLCYGQAISRTQYGQLFAIIGTAYGTGDGSTTFNVPDLRGRVVAGVDNMGGSSASRLTSTTITGGGDAVGEVGGSQTHTLTEAQMPSHTHIQNAHTHGVNRTTTSTFTNTTGSGDLFRSESYVADTVGTTTATNQNTGSGEAHPNVQPTMVLNYIIKAQ